MKAFVAGATGYTGRAVVRELAARGVDTIAHVRPDSPQLELTRADMAGTRVRVDTTVWDDAAMTQTMRRESPDLVFALLGTTAAKAKRAQRQNHAPADYEAVDYGLTMLLARATRTGAPGARFVYLSSIGAAEDARGVYLRVRGRVEREVREIVPRLLIARPSFLTGPDRAESRPMERAGAVVSDAVLGIVAALGMQRLAERYRSLDAVTFARGLVELALDPASQGRTVEAGNIRSAAAAAPLRHSNSNSN